MAGQTIRTKIVGVTFPNDDGVNRQRIIRKYCRAGMHLELIPESKNPRDRNAISVWIEVRRFLRKSRRYQVGYLSSELAMTLRPEVKRGAALSGVILGVTGGWLKYRGVNIEVSVWA